MKNLYSRFEDLYNACESKITESKTSNDKIKNLDDMIKLITNVFNSGFASDSILNTLFGRIPPKDTTTPAAAPGGGSAAKPSGDKYKDFSKVTNTEIMKALENNDNIFFIDFISNKGKKYEGAKDLETFINSINKANTEQINKIKDAIPKVNDKNRVNFIVWVNGKLDKGWTP
jgi:hypothetical protein